MVAQVQKWGNSQGIRLTKQILEDARISVGDEVDVTLKEGAIILTPLRPARRGVSLEDLVSRIPDDYEATEVDWGEPVGKEAW